MEQKLIDKKIIKMSGKEQLEYYLDNPDKMPIQHFNIFSEVGLDKMVQYLNQRPLEELLNLKIDKSIDLLYFFIIKKMEPEAALKFICDNQVHIECLTESEDLVLWLSFLDKNKAYEVLEKYAPYDPFITQSIFSGSAYTNEEVLSFLLDRKYQKFFSEDLQLLAWELDSIFEAKKFSIENCIRVFNNSSESTRNCLLFADSGENQTFLSILLIKEGFPLVELKK
jgi:hypothetical protein